VTIGPAADMREALEGFDAEERALLRVALTRASGDVDRDTERGLSLLVRYDTGRCSSLVPADRWELASALRRFRGMSWRVANDVARALVPDRSSEGE
jgi:hypothetical protein